MDNGHVMEGDGWLEERGVIIFECCLLKDNDM